MDRQPLAVRNPAPGWGGPQGHAGNEFRETDSSVCPELLAVAGRKAARVDAEPKLDCGPLTAGLVLAAAVVSVQVVGRVWARDGRLP